MGNPSNIRRNITLIFLGLIAIHFTTCLFLIFFPGRTLLSSYRLTSLYKIYALPGPFFKAELIQTSPHFFIRYKPINGLWTNWENPEKSNFLEYHKRPWKYYKLRQSSFERHLARTLGRKINKGGGYLQSREFNEVHRYFSDLYLPSNADSVSQLYILNHSDGQTDHVKSDTVFRITYKSF